MAPYAGVCEFKFHISRLLSENVQKAMMATGELENARLRHSPDNLKD